MPNLNFNPDNDIPDLTGKTIFITGGTNGLGAESAVHFAKHNPAHIYISGRNIKSAEKVIQRIRDNGSSTEVTFLECDLSSLASVKNTGEEFASYALRLDILMCNAGIMAQPPSLTTDGYEIQFGTNHLGHALLIKKLLPLLEKRSSEGKDPRIVILTSEGDPLYQLSFSSYIKYKYLGVIRTPRELARRYPGIISVSVHPGVVSTGLISNTWLMDRVMIYIWKMGKVLKPEEGAYNQIWAATAAKEKILNGMYYEPVGKLSQCSLDKTAKDDGLGQQLWDWTEEALEGF